MFEHASNMLLVSGGRLAQSVRRARGINKLPSPDMGVLLSPLLRVRARTSSCSSTLRIGCSSCLKTLRISCSSRRCSLGVFGVLREINKLPSSDMGVLLSPPPAGSGKGFVVFKHAPNRLFVVLKDASNKLFVSRVS